MRAASLGLMNNTGSGSRRASAGVSHTMRPRSYSARSATRRKAYASRPGVSVVAGANSDLGVIALTPLGPPPPPPPPPPGAITGAVSPAGLPTTVTLMLNGNVIATTDVAMDGSFAFSGVAPGTYDVMFHPAFDYPDSTVSGVVVNSGATTDMGVVPL